MQNILTPQHHISTNKLVFAVLFSSTKIAHFTRGFRKTVLHRCYSEREMRRLESVLQTSSVQFCTIWQRVDIWQASISSIKRRDLKVFTCVCLLSAGVCRRFWSLPRHVGRRRTLGDLFSTGFVQGGEHSTLSLYCDACMCDPCMWCMRCNLYVLQN